MKKTKKIFALLITVVMVLSMGITAFASESNSHTITITNSDSSVQHIYEAYQVFAGDLDAAENKLSNIIWGSGVNGAALLTALQADATIGADFATCTTAADVADVLSGYANNSVKLDAFGTIVGQNLSTTVAGTSTATSSPYTIGVSGDGYYFIKDKNDTVTEGTESYSKYMLNVVKDVTIEAKDDQFPPHKEADKEIAAIGSDINYTVTMGVPNMNGYSTYTMVMNDKMSMGLTFKEISSVKVGSKTLTKVDAFEDDMDPTTVYTVTTSTDATTKETTVTLTFYDFIQYKGETGNIEVKYVATINEDARVGTEDEDGVRNDVTFTHSNNPYDSHSTSVTPHSETVTYVTEINLLKVDASDNTKKLAGAEFKLEGSALKTVLITGVKYEKAPYTAGEGETIDDAGPFYKLKDGSYTKTEPTDATAARYDDRNTTYVQVSYTNIVQKPAQGTVTYTGITDKDGKLQFTGLDAGTYTLTELTAPDGFNLLTSPIEITIGWNSETKKFTVTGTGATVAADGTISITVENNGGTQLPSTGGIGTTIFYIIGAILVVGAGVILVTRRRMNNK